MQSCSGLVLEESLRRRHCNRFAVARLGRQLVVASIPPRLTERNRREQLWPDWFYVPRSIVSANINVPRWDDDQRGDRCRDPQTLKKGDTGIRKIATTLPAKEADDIRAG
jgi:hypothetical protein